MDRLTNHFDYCKMIDCKFYDPELRKQDKCKFFDVGIEHCHEKRLNDKLREYEDLDEQGLLLRLPCKVGNMVYLVDSSLRTIHLFLVKEIKINKYETLLSIEYAGTEQQFRHWEIRTELSKLGKWFFLTKEEAEAALERMGE